MLLFHKTVVYGNCWIDCNIRLSNMKLLPWERGELVGEPKAFCQCFVLKGGFFKGKEIDLTKCLEKKKYLRKYLWKNWQLGHCDGAPLCIPPVGPRPIRNTPLCELGIGNHSIITFVPAPTHRKPKKKFF